MKWAMLALCLTGCVSTTHTSSREGPAKAPTASPTAGSAAPGSFAPGARPPSANPPIPSGSPAPSNPTLVHPPTPSASPQCPQTQALQITAALDVDRFLAFAPVTTATSVTLAIPFTDIATNPSWTDDLDLAHAPVTITSPDPGACQVSVDKASAVDFSGGSRVAYVGANSPDCLRWAAAAVSAGAVSATFQGVTSANCGTIRSLDLIIHK